MKQKHVVFICDPPVGDADKNVGGTHGVIGNLRDEMESAGHQVTIISGLLFGEVPADQTAYSYLTEKLDALDFDMVHIVTQGKLGLLGRRYCVANGIKFTTAYHTQIPEYLEVRNNIPASNLYAYVRWFCNAAACTITPTPEMAQRLTANGVTNAVPCLHGVNTERFRPRDKNFVDLPRPIFLYVGRVSPEKNVQAFLNLDLPGTKLVVGGASGGMKQDELEALYPDVHFAGVKMGDELAKYYACADVFVFPSRTDTFGLVLLEAIASGVPVAAYPVTGPIDVVTDPKVGVLDEDLRAAALSALDLSSEDCRAFGEAHSWKEATQRFLDLQVDAGSNRLTGEAKERELSVESSLEVGVLAELIGGIEQMLFGDEPAGPYDKGGKPKA